MPTSMEARDLVDFDRIESQKENIEPIRQGRSVTSLAKAFDTNPVVYAAEADKILYEYEQEIKDSTELDDPLEVWVRYITWMKGAFPAGHSAQNGYTQLLERCSKQFIHARHYANDPRYLKIWIDYARYSDDPRELFCFLARNELGQELATFYEEYAAFLETRNRKGQADEIYQLGLSRGARPINRLKRKYAEFSQRLMASPPLANEPSSPPIAPIRSALTTKFGGLGEIQQKVPARVTAQKLEVFTDASDPSAASQIGSGGWGSIGTLQNRRKENTLETKKMFGETLPQHHSTTTVGKLEIFKDEPTVAVQRPPPAIKRSERVVCDLEAIYATDGEEYSFEELKARAMGIVFKPWIETIQVEQSSVPGDSYVSVMDTLSPLKESPARKVTKRQMASPTINTKAAMDDILGLFNQPLKCEQSDESSDADSDDEEPENTYSVVQHNGTWTQSCAQHNVVSNDQSDFDEAESVLTDATRRAPFEGTGVEQVLQPLSELTMENNAAQVTIPATPQQTAPIARANGFAIMTPITEDTENLYTSVMRPAPMAILQEDQDEFVNNDLYSSPFIENPPPRTTITSRSLPPLHSALADMAKTRPKSDKPQSDPGIKPGPVIKELVCNPMDETVRSIICSSARPPISAYEGSHISLNESYAKKFEAIEKYIRALNKKNGDATQHLEVTLDFASRYAIKRKLGEGAFAPVFLVENISGCVPRRAKLEALKIEKPGSSWEFYMMRQIHRRVGVSRASQSIARAHEFYCFLDSSFLILDYKDQGTILDLVNIYRTESGGVDEMLAIFLTVEVMRTIEALHSRGIMHGDLKADNCLLRLEELKDGDWSSAYEPTGTGGWEHKGITLIDFGRGIDMRHFDSQIQFIADWRTDEQDCAEMREARPWTYQIDYHGLACIAHSLLFGKYIDTVAAGGIGERGKRTVLKSAFKRYWKQDIWEPLFDLLLNPKTHGSLPVTACLKECRERMEHYLKENASAGLGLKGIIRKVEIELALAKKR